MKQEDIKRVLSLNLPVIYKGVKYGVSAGFIKYSKNLGEFIYSVELIENYYDKTKANSVVYANIKDVEIMEE